MFQPAEHGLVPAEGLLKFEVGDRAVTGYEEAREDDSVYRYDISGIDCADARLIAAAPQLHDAAVDALEAFRLLRDGLSHDAKAVEMIDAHIDDLEIALMKARGQ
jgi:hypothetical protein